MIAERTDRNTRQLEEALRQALEESLKTDSKSPLMDFLHETFSCERVYLFERNQQGRYDPTYEWTTEGTPHNASELRGLSDEDVAPYYTRYTANSERILVIRDVEEIRDADRELYDILAPAGVRSIVSGQLFAHDRDLGFFGFDNPAREDIEYLLHLVRSIRNFLSVELLYAHTGEKLLNIGFSNHLTNIGDWHELYEYTEGLDRKRSIGVVFSNLIDLRRINAMRGRQAGDSLLVETGHIFTDVFDMERVFRLSGDKHCAVVDDVSYKWLEKKLQILVSTFRERGIDIEIGAVWEPMWDGNPDDLIHRASLKMRDISDVDVDGGVVPLEATAEAPLYRNDQFISSAGAWLRSEGLGRIAVVTVRIDHYRLFSDLYDMDKGAYTRSIATVLQGTAGIYRGVAGFMGDGCFCLMVPLEGMTETELLSEIRGGIRLMSIARGFSPLFGVYITDHVRETASELFERSMSAIEQIPEQSDNKVGIITDRQVAQVLATQELLRDPWQLLRSGEFSFVLQRVFDLGDRHVCTREAFARWRHGGDVYLPEVFLPGMRRNESVYALDRLMLDELTQLLRSEREASKETVPISVNLEAIDLTIGDQARHLSERIHACALPSGSIAVEVPLMLAIRYYREACRFADTLFAADIPLILDDLSEYPLERGLIERMHACELKISGHFTHHICANREDQEIVRRIAELAHSCDIPVVAKHIESNDQAVMMRTLGCDRGQGYLFDRPAAPFLAQADSVTEP